MTPKHTPGPWELHGSRVVAPQMGKIVYDNRSAIAFGTEKKLHQYKRPYIVCQPYLYSDPGNKGIECDENIANGHLIAAAPELFHACEMALSQLDALKNGNNFKCYGIIKAAIAKAEGK